MGREAHDRYSMVQFKGKLLTLPGTLPPSLVARIWVFVTGGTRRLINGIPITTQRVRDALLDAEDLSENTHDRCISEVCWQN